MAAAAARRRAGRTTARAPHQPTAEAGRAPTGPASLEMPHGTVDPRPRRPRLAAVDGPGIRSPGCGARRVGRAPTKPPCLTHAWPRERRHGLVGGFWDYPLSTLGGSRRPDMARGTPAQHWPRQDQASAQPRRPRDAHRHDRHEPDHRRGRPTVTADTPSTRHSTTMKAAKSQQPLWPSRAVHCAMASR